MFYAHLKFEMQQNMCKEIQKSEINTGIVTGCTVYSDATIQALISLFFLVFLYLLAQIFVASQILHEHWTLRHVSIHIFVIIFGHIWMSFFSNGSIGVWWRGGSTGYVLGDLVLKAQPKTRIPIIVSETICKLCVITDRKILCKHHISWGFCWRLEDNTFFIFLF